MVTIGERIRIVGTPAFKGKLATIVEVNPNDRVFKVEIKLGHRVISTYYHFEDEGKIYTRAT